MMTEMRHSLPARRPAWPAWPAWRDERGRGRPQGTAWNSLRGLAWVSAPQISDEVMCGGGGAWPGNGGTLGSGPGWPLLLATPCTPCTPCQRTCASDMSRMHGRRRRAAALLLYTVCVYSVQCPSDASARCALLHQCPVVEKFTTPGLAWCDWPYRQRHPFRGSVQPASPAL